MRYGAVVCGGVSYQRGICDGDNGQCARGIDSTKVRRCGGGGWQMIHVVLRDVCVT